MLDAGVASVWLWHETGWREYPMRPWNPSTPITANLLDFRLPARFFIEQDETTVDDRAGWATPRKRPRRVHKKLAKRWFQTHYVAPAIGTSGWSRKCRRWHGRAPKLAVWLRGVEQPGFAPEVAVRFEPVLFDGKVLVEPHFPKEALASRVVYTLSAPLLNARVEPGAPPSCISIAWRGQNMAFELYAQKRRIYCTLAVFTPEGVRPDHPTVAAKVELAGYQIARAMLAAAQGLHETTVIARQTTRRPGVAGLDVAALHRRQRGPQRRRNSP
jgi:hypothetical protein